MANQKQLTREVIIQTLTIALEPLDYIHAFWEGGAVAYNRIDDWSDIDLYLIADNERINETFLAVESTLKSLSPIKQKYEVPQSPWPGVSQAFYKLEDANDYLAIDLAIMTPDSPEKFLTPQIHGKAFFYFNKNNMVKLPRLDEKAFTKKLQARLENLEARFNMFNNFVQKEINRGNFLEAMGHYIGFTLGTLVEVLRIKYYPTHYEFKLRYIHYELPPKVIRKLENLYFVADSNELQEKYSESSSWFKKLMAEIDMDEMGRLVKTA